MRQEQENIGKTLDRLLARYANPSSERMEAAIERVSESLRSETPSSGLSGHALPQREGSLWTRRWVWIGAAAAIAIAIIVPMTMLPSAPAILEDANGSRKIAYGEVVHPTRGAGGMLVLSDHSHVELRQESELTLERADDGVSIRLAKGGVIVSAAKQRSGHLYVQTKDVTVSVVGTVFAVTAEETGSRVAVIEGEVHVQQGSTEKKLRSGERATSNPSLEPRLVWEEIGWSRNIEAHLALLQQSVNAPAPNKDVFELASVKMLAPSSDAAKVANQVEAMSATLGCPGGSIGPIQLDPGRLRMPAVTVLTLVIVAYGQECTLVEGGPAWARSGEYYEINALLPAGTPSYKSQDLAKGDAPKLQRMLQSLLADRFRLVLRHELREMPVYTLTVANRAKLKLSPDETLPIPAGLFLPGFPMPPLGRGQSLRTIQPSGEAQMFGHAISLSDLAKNLRQYAGRIVIDKTGLSGVFDIDLKFEFARELAPSTTAIPAAPTPPIPPLPGEPVPGAPLRTVLEDKLGLKLESARMPLEVLVIESVERPPNN